MPEAPFDDPYEWFVDWFSAAEDAGIKEFNAMVLSTVSERGEPSSRVVLLKDHGPDEYVFYTNYRSRKGVEIDATGQAALNFYWRSMDRQIRIAGPAERVDPEVSDGYFATRPRGSKIGAWASDQSEELDRRQTLVHRVEEFEERFEGQDVPRPDHWGGYKLMPLRIEFWEAGAFRLHDRWEFRRDHFDEGWSLRRLNP
jgi:pyridoxamine 5'-phosphate oxidase